MNDTSAPDPALARYFERIGYRHRGVADLAALRALQRRHTLAIPFENLSPLAGQPVRLQPEALLDKFARGRGGYCFEHNRVFQHALAALGFTVTPLMARVRLNVPEGVTTPRSHMLLEVEADGATWIADTGFGRMTPTGPLRLAPGPVQDTPHGRYRLMADEAGYRLEARSGAAWQPLYIFDLRPAYPIDFEVSNWYVSTHPASHFTRELVVARATPQGREVLHDTRHSIYPLDGEPQQRQLGGADEMLEVLATRFGIDGATIPGLHARLAGIAAQARDGTA